MGACEERLDPVSCRLDVVVTLLERQGQVGLTALVVALISAAVATVLAVAALRASSAANRLATQNVDLIRRSERRRLVDALEAYRASRAKDMGLGQRSGIRHYLPLARGIIAEIDEPNAEVLTDWLTTAIDTIIDDPDEAERRSDRHRASCAPRDPVKSAKPPCAHGGLCVLVGSRRFSRGGGTAARCCRAPTPRWCR